MHGVIEPSPRGAFMRVKLFAFVLIVGSGAMLFVAMRSANRADAANGNCEASAQGPSTPTICN
jgi:hypothetical protein